MWSNWKLGICSFTFLVLGVARVQALPAQGAEESTAVPNRVTQPIDETKMVRLVGNVHPLAQGTFDRGQVSSGLPLDRIVMVLKRSPEQEAALTSFMAEQLDKNSPNFHHWLSPEEFGKKYGPSDNDMRMITSWLQNRGFQIGIVSKGRVTIEFSGTAGQVQQAFRTEIHNYMVRGAAHIANVGDPQIPEALAPVVQGIASLHNFFPQGQSIFGDTVTRDLKTGKVTATTPKATGSGPVAQFTYTDGNGFTREDISPYDFATIYNLLPLWNAGINGTGQTIAISGASDITLADVANFRSAFGLPVNAPQIIHNGTAPGLVAGARGENTLDVEWSGATAPKAHVVMVVTGSTQTSFGGQLSDSYIVDNGLAPVMSASYGECELNLGSSGNALYNGIWQQGAVEGISIFESAGDQGSAGCQSQDTAAPNPATTGLQVNGMASSPYVTAVGGTDFLWQNDDISKYWNASNNGNGATAKGYIPEIPWNSTCTSSYILTLSADSTSEQFCNDVYNGQYSAYEAFLTISAGSGGKSFCTNPTGTKPANCAGGYSKPPWQVAAGVPNDGKRDVPDVSMFASAGYPDGFVGSAYLICDSENGACNYSDPSKIGLQEVGGTSVSSPAMAGIMSLVVQKLGSPQGLANPVFYALFAKESVSGCNSNTVGNGSGCVFYDTTSGTISQVCVTGSPNCVTNTSGDTFGVLSGFSTTSGYDLATGLGSINATNLVNGWSAALAAQAITFTPTSLTFTSTGVGKASAAQTITVHNTGSGAHTVGISSVELTGTNAAAYGASTNCGATLNAGATCTVTVTFKPTATGTQVAAVRIFDNATGSSQAAPLSGTISSGTAAVVSYNPHSLTFAATKVGVTTAAQTVTVQNTGNANLTFSSLTFTGPGASSFLKTTTCSTTLVPTATCAISVSFKPAGTGPFDATLNLNDSLGTQTVSLTGSGTSSSQPTLSLTPGTLTFANTVTGITSVAQIITLTNPGSVTATLSGIAITGANASSFTQLNTCVSATTAGSNCVIYVSFKPTTTGALTGALTITSNAAGSPQSVALHGTGTAVPPVAFSSTSLTFSSTPLGAVTRAQGVTVKNNGTAPLVFNSISITGANASSFLLESACSSPLAPSATCSVLVSLKPAAAGTLKANLSFADNGVSSPQLVSLTGTGQ